MEEIEDRVQTFLKEITEPAQSPSEENSHPRVIGNYSLLPEEVPGQVIDWVLMYLENRKCPYQLAVNIASNVAQLINASMLEQNSIQSAEADQSKWLESLTVYTEVIKRVPEVCTSLLEQTSVKDICSTISSPYSASVFAIKNKRRKMEDRHVIHHDLNSLLNIKNAPHHSYYAVFDGHSGIDAASYASAQLHINIAKHPAFLTDTRLAIHEAYKITDENFLKRRSNENMKSGCTAISALIRENTMYLSWLGDSQAVLVKQGKPIMVTDPHKPEREDEKQRIENLGGHVTCVGVWRVNGILAVTRALGDPDHKPFISNEPEINVINLDQTEDFLILACDGLWDGMSPEDVTSALYCYLSESAVDEPLDTIAAKLVHQSKLQGSEDNITTVVVFLRDIKDIKADAIKYMANLSQATAQMREFLSVNGELSASCTSAASDVPFAKPTVLELNSASSKKLKNTANVLSSTGFGNSSYSYSYSENPFHDISSQITSGFSAVENAQNVFISHQNSASCFAPEATALSELPTPPIDDVLALQSFEKFSSADLNQNLDSVVAGTCQHFYSSDTESVSAPIVVNESETSAIFLHEDSASEQRVDLTSHCEFEVESQITKGEVIESDANQVPTDITPDEAVGIASSVVTNAIETAVKSLSSETNVSVTSQNPQKLNPYAEPFVMKSFFITEGNEMENKNITTETTSANNFNVSSHVDSENLELEKPDECEVDAPDVKDSSYLINTSAKEFQTSQSCEVMEKIASEELSSVVNTSNENLIDLNSSFVSDLKSSFDSVDSTNLKNFPLSKEIDTDLKLKPNISNQAEMLYSEKGKVDMISTLPSGDVSCELIRTTTEREESVIIKESPLSEKNDCNPTDEICSSTDIAKESVSLINVQNTILNAVEPVLPTNNISEDTHVETFAVDLQSVPDGVPEAEGVTEDIDSDSEKDGGWSYMKGNVDSTTKTKNENEQPMKIEKSGLKCDTNSKLKKDISKPALDIKNKVKGVTPDKARKIDKKVVDPKEKEKSKSNKSSALTLHSKASSDKISRITSTVSRVKKETVVTSSRITTTVTAATTTAAASTVNRLVRPAAQRNIGISGKTANVLSADKNLSSMKSNASSNAAAAAKPKTALSVQENKSNIRPTSSVTKGQPSNQSSKSSITVRSAPNRLAPTVPSKASLVTKPLPLSKSAPESKPKQPVSTVKRTVPSLLKKSDMKETKDSVNKQISAGKNATVNKVSTATTSIVSNKTSAVAASKRTVTLSNKSTISKTSSGTLVKTDLLKKDVPKIPSKCSPRNSAASKPSKEEVKGKEKNVLVQNKSEEKKNNMSGNGEHETDATEMSSGEEKFILETSDKETIVKEQSEVPGDCTNHALNNGTLTECIIPVESQTPVPCSSESNL